MDTISNSLTHGRIHCCCCCCVSAETSQPSHPDKTWHSIRCRPPLLATSPYRDTEAPTPVFTMATPRIAASPVDVLGGRQPVCYVETEDRPRLRPASLTYRCFKTQTRRPSRPASRDPCPLLGLEFHRADPRATAHSSLITSGPSKAPCFLPGCHIPSFFRLQSLPLLRFFRYEVIVGGWIQLEIDRFTACFYFWKSFMSVSLNYLSKGRDRLVCKYRASFPGTDARIQTSRVGFIVI